MSCLLLSRLSRLCLRKPSVLGVRHLCGSRFLSDTPIYRIVSVDPCRDSPWYENIGRLVVRNVKSCMDEVLEKTVPIELFCMNGTIGASHGWVATLDKHLVCLRDDLNPGASDSDPKKITQHRPKTLPHCQTQLVTNVAMSSSPEDEDCVMAIKFLGPQLSFCRPTLGYTEWVNIRIEDPCFFSSRVMYSNKYKMFSMLSSDATCIGYWDPEKKDRCHKKLRDYGSYVYKQFKPFDLKQMSEYCRSEHLVEAPTGETFIVKWYTDVYSGEPVWRRFMVFEVQEDGGIYIDQHTYDIGDLCIFLSSKGEPFCLKASLYDGLTPNCIYYVGDFDYGKVNIRDNVKVGGYASSPAPYFIPPQSS